MFLSSSLLCALAWAHGTSEEMIAVAFLLGSEAQSSPFISLFPTSTGIIYLRCESANACSSLMPLDWRLWLKSFLWLTCRPGLINKGPEGSTRQFYVQPDLGRTDLHFAIQDPQQGAVFVSRPLCLLQGHSHPSSPHPPCSGNAKELAARQVHGALCFLR